MNNYKISMSSREAVTRDLRIFISAGTANEREKIRRSRITTLRDDRSLYDNSNNGFTLIELLVVILIIGILAAVALPQYTLAVNKTRFASLRSTAMSLVKASEAYFLANNEWATDFDSLALDLPAGMTVSTVNGGTCGVNNDMYCCIIPNANFSPAIVCGRNDYTFAFHTASSRTEPAWKNFCIAKKSDENAVKLCKSLGTARNDWGFFTPQGSKDTGYRYYTLNQ